MSTRTSRKDSQARTRKRLVGAGSRVFRSHGFHRASTEAIASAAGYTRGALYANFASKEQLFLAVLDEEIASRYDLLAKPLASDVLAARYCKLLDEDPEWTLALLEFSILAARDPALAAQMRRRNREIRAVIAGVIQAKRPSVSPELAAGSAKLVLAVNTGVSLERALDVDAAGANELARGYDAALGEVDALTPRP